MRHLWRTSGVFGLLLVAMVVMGPQTGWSKGERSSHVMRLENGAVSYTHLTLPTNREV